MSGIIEKMKDVLHVGHKEEGKHEEFKNKAEHGSGGGDSQDSKGLMNKIKKKLGDRRRCRRGGKGRRQEGGEYKEGEEEKEPEEGDEEKEDESESESESESDGGSE